MLSKLLSIKCIDRIRQAYGYNSFFHILYNGEKYEECGTN
jgi:hypothetical protein